MPANPASLRLTDLYRTRHLAIRERVERDADQTWRRIENLDRDYGRWVQVTTNSVAFAQTEAIRAAAGYLSAFISLELGRRTPPPSIDTRELAGRSRDGRPLADALQSPLIGVKTALKEGRPYDEALDLGRARATRMVGVDTDHAGRTALLEAIDRDERIDGWQRSVRGTCGACAAVATGPTEGLQFEVHPGCQCVSAPIVKGVSDLHPIPTGAVIFEAKSHAEQNEMLGEEKASLVRSGRVGLADLVSTNPQATAESFITEKPLEALVQ